MPGLKLDCLTFDILVMAHFINFGISMKRASRDLQFITTMTKS